MIISRKLRCHNRNRWSRGHDLKVVVMKKNKKKDKKEMRKEERRKRNQRKILLKAQKLVI